MDLRQLEVFVTVAEELNFTRASDRLEVAQGAVSQSIQALERSLGARLFARTNRRVALTPAGESLLPQARSLLRQATSMRDEIRRAARGEIGRLRLGVMGAATHTWLPRLIREFRTTRPEVMVEIAEMTPTQQLMALDNRRIDLGFARKPPLAHTDEVVTQLVYVDELVLCLPADEIQATLPASLANYADRDFVLYAREEAPELVDLMREHARSAGFSPRVVAEARLMATVPLMVACGVGISLVPGSVRTLSQPGVQMVCTTPRSAAVPLIAMFRPEPSRLLRTFLHHLEESRPWIAKEMEMDPCPVRTAEAIAEHPGLTPDNGKARLPNPQESRRNVNSPKG
jgi:DNA-binding transcriptional LysR family regulator